MSKSAQEKRISDEKYTAGREFERTSKIYTRRMVPDAPPALKVLDIGCGTGLNAQTLAAKGHDVAGVDLSAVAVEKFNALGFRGVTHDISQGLPFEDAAFDLVFASEVIEHLGDTEQFLSDINRVLKPGGMLVLSTPNSAFWVYRLLTLAGQTLSEIQHPGHVRFFSKASLRAAIEQAGFEISHLSGRNMFLVMPKALGGVLARYGEGLGFHQEMRFKTKKEFVHWSFFAERASGFWTDTLIVRAVKTSAPADPKDGA